MTSLLDCLPLTAVCDPATVASFDAAFFVDFRRRKKDQNTKIETEFSSIRHLQSTLF